MATVVNSVVKCSVCGKHLTSAASVTGVCGAKCSKLLATHGLTGLQQLHAAKVVQSTTGLYKVSQWDKVCKKLGISISKMVAAFGGDRGIYPTALPAMQFVYNQNKHRFITGYVFTAAALQLVHGSKLGNSAVMAAVTSVLGKAAAAQIAKLPAAYGQVTPMQFVANGNSYTPQTTTPPTA